MKKAVLVFAAAALMVTLSSCNPLEWRASANKNPLEEELKTAEEIVFTNKKEAILKFTVADPVVIKHIASIVSNGSPVDRKAEVEPDYVMNFYMPTGKEMAFEYWMGASEYDKDINLKDSSGNYYLTTETMDVYILNNAKMSLRPKEFVNLYSECISKTILGLEKDKRDITTVGVDILSDRRMRKYTMSYEDQEIFKSIKAEGCSILPWNDKGKFTYNVSYVTNMYNPDKAKITVEVFKVIDKTKQTFVYDGVLKSGDIWEIKSNK